MPPARIDAFVVLSDETVVVTVTELEDFTSLCFDNDIGVVLSDLENENPVVEEDAGSPNPGFTASVEGFGIGSKVFTEPVELKEKPDFCPTSDGASPPAGAGTKDLLERDDPKLKPSEADFDAGTEFCLFVFKLKLIEERGDAAAVAPGVEVVVDILEVEIAPTKPEPEAALKADVTGGAAICD